ncbi:hypothetical protein HHK36_002129 [Tetracentron sinense]|uniref:DUF4408 domain-containing protein n=1 Tax=Tetracentron sinense TaxID=13715 RepID=A0A834ZYP4_TETSI|nr:hypothetical protein HHK36_002129 [Tetracentron sinense]
MDKSQVAKLSLIAILLLITPLLSTSKRPPYVYFIINLLIIALGAEAGLLSSFSMPQDDKKPANITPKPVVVVEVSEKRGSTSIIVPECNGRKAKVVEKSASEKFVAVVNVHKVKKCPSMPSLFFIGSGEAEEEEVTEEYEEVGGISGPELFTKAETFIGNFYKQLKIQREESWKRIHGFYQTAF